MVLINIILALITLFFFAVGLYCWIVSGRYPVTKHYYRIIGTSLLIAGGGMIIYFINS